jgi:hypothetical protein
MGYMFDGSKLSTTNYDALLIGWNSLPLLRSNVPFSAGNSNYCNGASARTSLAATYNWYITDGGLDCTSLGTESFEANNILLYPNPTSELLHIETKINEVFKISVFNQLGQEVVKKTELNENKSIDVSNLSKGLYFLNIDSEDGNTQTIKFIKN